MSQNPEEIRDDIEATRAAMDATLDQIEDRIAPRRIAERKKDQARSFLHGAKESIMGTAQDAKDSVMGTAQDAKDSVMGTAHDARDRVPDGAQVEDAAHRSRQAAERGIRGNPIAAGLIAFGAGALAGSLLPSTRAEERAARHLEPAIASMKEELAHAGSDVAQELKQEAQQAGEEVRDVAHDAVEEVKQEATGALESTQEEARGAVESVKEEAQEGLAGDGGSSGPPQQRSGTSASTYGERTLDELIEEAGRHDITGRWSMNKDELIAALQEAEASSGGTSTPSRSHVRYEDRTVDELQALAASRDITGRSSMTKDELIRALRG